MNASQLLILFTGALAIIFTYWFFFGKKEGRVEVSGSSIDIKVDAGYSPSNIVLKKNNPVTLNIKRVDSSDCLQDLVIPQWGINKFLPLNKNIQINIKPEKTGEFPFHCGMNMFHGKIIVK